MSAPTTTEALEVVGDVRIELPADDRFLRVARLTAAGLADEAGFDVEGVEDLRVVVDEATVALIAVAEPGSSVALHFQVAMGRVDFHGTVASEAVPALHPVAESVLEVLTEGLVLHHGSGGGSIRFAVVRDLGRQEI